MNDAVTVRPVEGRLILMPDRDFLPVPDEGVRVFRDAFYTRAIEHGDLEIVPDPVDEPAPTLFDPPEDSDD